MGKIMLNGKQYGVGGITDADDVKYTSSQTVKDALDDVNGRLDKVVFKVGNLSANTSKNYNIQAGTRFFVFTSGASGAVQGIAIGNTGSTNSLTVSYLNSTNNYGITCSVANGVLTIANTSANYVEFAILVYAGRIS